MSNQASENWWRAFCTGGSIVSDCVCGRTVYAGNSDHSNGWERDEYEKLEALSIEHPDKYIPVHGDDSVSVADTGHVWGCPCGGSVKYEEFLQKFRHEILDYYRREIADEKAALERSVAALNATGTT